MKDKPTKGELQSEKDQLESLIPDLNDTSLQDLSNIPMPTKTIFTNFQTIIDQCDEEAELIIKNLAQFFLSEEDMINKYVIDKMSMDKMELSNLIFQSRSAKTSYVKLLEEIDAGNVHPRIFEVQAGLQKSMMEITKAKTSYIQIMENSWKNIKAELGIKEIIKNEELEEDSSFKSKGTKAFLKSIQQEVNPDREHEFYDKSVNVESGKITILIPDEGTEDQSSST